MSEKMIGKMIKLTEEEKALCEKISEARFENNRKSNVTNSKIGGQDNKATDFIGFSCEFAFCKLFNLFPDFSIEPRSSQAGQDKNSDVRLPNGKTVDVKGTRYGTGRLLAVPWKSNSTDLFALIIFSNDVYCFKGFMSANELLKNERLIDLGHGLTYAANQSELLELDDIKLGD